MDEFSKLLKRVHNSAEKKRFYTPHSLRQMSRPDRMITTSEVRNVIENGKVIEDYHNDPRGHSCLMFGYGDRNRPIHVVCSPKENFLAIITAYIPNKKEWEENYKRRLSP